MKDNVCIVVVDAARASNFSCYGHQRETTPNIDTVAEESIVFDQAVSPAGATFASVGSLLTGKYPAEHQAGLDRRIAVESPMLPELFSDEGYRTGAITTNPFITPGFGFEQGIDVFKSIEHRFDQGMNIRKFFDKVRDRPNPEIYLRFLRRSLDQNFPAHVGNALQFRFDLFTREDQGAKQATQRANRFVSESADPWFLYLHYTEAHMKSVTDMYKVPESARYRYVSKDDTDTVDLVQGKDDQSPYPAQDVHERLYDGALFYDDFYVGKLVDKLKKSGQWDDTLFVIMADHGECLGENGRVGHGFVSEPCAHVPLIVKPGRSSLPGADTEKRVNTLGIFNTLCNLLDVDPIGSVSDIFAEPEKTVLMQEYSGGWQWSSYGMDAHPDAEYALYRDGLKLIRYHDRTALYDVNEDPTERTEIKDEDLVDEFDKELDDRLSEFPELQSSSEDLSINAGTESRLEDLGYM